tara:strand:- start:127 stop:1098 length:972 start_codon:yes stop_codon:yes gene_type:complete
MKFLETSFSDYISSINKENLHKELLSTYKYFPEKINDLSNLIFYGPAGCGKYTQALYSIEKYSPSKLKYERKIKISVQKKQQYLFNISDIHFEIDMDLLGCNARILWNDIYHHILDILATRSNPYGIIICKNFHNIHSELLDVFYSYMENLNHINIKLVYILITEQISFLPEKILKSCKIIPVARPTKKNYKKILQKDNKTLINKNIKTIKNIKNLHSEIDQISQPYKILCTRIINQLDDHENLNFMLLRENLYNLFIYQLDINECLLFIIFNYIKKKKINKENIFYIFKKLPSFLKYYNNNYRPIYHLESFILSLCKTIHGL